MTPTLESLGIDRMTVHERVALAQAIWDNIPPEVTPLSDSQKQEVDRRLAAHRSDPTAAIPWEQVEAEALARLPK